MPVPRAAASSPRPAARSSPAMRRRSPSSFSPAHLTTWNAPQAQLRLRRLRTDHGMDPLCPVRGHVRQQPGALLAEGTEERLHGGLAAALADPGDPPGIVIGHDDQVLALPLAPGLLINADPAQPVEAVQPRGRVRADPGDGVRQRLPRDPQLRRGPRPGHVRRLPRREPLKRPAEPVIMPRPRHRRGDLPVPAAEDPRQPRLQERPLAVHVQGPPPHHVVLHRPAALPALRAPSRLSSSASTTMTSTFSGTRSLRGQRSTYVLITTACSVPSTSSHTGPATSLPPVRHAPSPSGTGRYRATGRPLSTDTPQKSVTAPNLRAGESPLAGVTVMIWQRTGAPDRSIWASAVSRPLRCRSAAAT